MPIHGRLMLKKINEMVVSDLRFNLKTDIMSKFADACSGMIVVAA